MSATLSTTVRPAVSKRRGAFSGLLSASCNGIAGYFARRAAIESLSGLDDRALWDIGIKRSQIEAAVHGFISLSPSSEGEMASTAVMLSCANARRRASTAETASWN